MTAWGSVGRPVLIFSIALLSAILGIYSYYDGNHLGTVAYTIFSGGTSAVAIYQLYAIISIVEFASLRRARTVIFDVRFHSGEKSHEIKQGKQAKIRLGFAPIKEDVDDVLVLLFFPSEFDIARKNVLVQPQYSEHANLKTIAERFGFMPHTLFYPIDVDVLAKKTGKYKIIVNVRGRGIHRYSEELTLNVVK